MTASQDKRGAEDADPHCAEGARCEPRSRGLGRAMPTRPRVLVVAADHRVGASLHQALEAEYEVSWVSSLADPFDGLLQDAEIAVVDWSTLGRLVLETNQEGRKRGTRTDPVVSDKLKAVQQLGAILKSLSAGSRAVRRRIT
jgi:hypothetical protein